MSRRRSNSSYPVKRTRKTELDRISNLPSDVIQRILSYLPIKEAGRTSILSNEWRFKWYMLSSLAFDHDVDDPKTVHQALLLHPGPIDSFKLSVKKLSAKNHMDTSFIDQWMRLLSRNPIKQFILKECKSRRRPYYVSSSLFSYQYLTHLELRDCMLRLPRRFNGFKMLKNLDIRRVAMARAELEKMIFSSPLLERFTLCDLEIITCLKIQAPNLQFLKIRGDFNDVELTKTLNLVDVSLDRKYPNGNEDRLLKLCVKLPYVKRLTIEGCILHCAIGSLPKELRTPCLYLNFLSINIRLNKLEEILIAICLLRSSPALQELEISVRQENEATNAKRATSWLNENQNWEFAKLQRVKATGLCGAKVEVEFIKFLLLSSPALQELDILFGEKENKKIMRKKISGDDAATGYEDNRRCTFTQLRVMNISGFSSTKAEEGFLKFFLTSSPMLERITLQPASAELSWEVSKVLTEFMSNSVQANLKLLDPLNPSDDSPDPSDVHVDPQIILTIPLDHHPQTILTIPPDHPQTMTPLVNID